MKRNHWIIKTFFLFSLCFLMIAVSDAEAQRGRSKKDKGSKEKKEKKGRRSRDKEEAETSDDGKLSRDEQKALKKELKAYKKNLGSFKQFKEDKVQAESELASTKKDLVRVKELEAQCAKEVDELRKQIEDLNARLADCNKKPDGFGIPSSGLYYVVQIGAFQQSSVSTNQNNPDFRSENDQGFNKYIMGVFPEISQADQLRAFLLELDFRSNPEYRPFIAPYRDGQRITIEDALGADEAARRRQSNGQ